MLVSDDVKSMTTDEMKYVACFNIALAEDLADTMPETARDIKFCADLLLELIARHELLCALSRRE